MKKILTTLLLIVAAFSVYSQNYSMTNLDVRNRSTFRGFHYIYDSTFFKPDNSNLPFLASGEPLGWVMGTQKNTGKLVRVTIGNLLSRLDSTGSATPTPYTTWVRDTTNHELYPATLTDQVGIGTADPNEQLELTGNFRIPATTATVGQIKQGATTVYHSYTDNLNLPNYFVGKGSGNYTMTGNNNIGIGLNALNAVDTGYSLIGIGYHALQAIPGGNHNIAIGHEAMAEAGSLSTMSIGIGYAALAKNNSSTNVAVGTAAMMYNVNGSCNTAVGSSALRYSLAIDNTALGSQALGKNTIGIENVGLGVWTLYNNLTGDKNVAIGQNAAYTAVKADQTVYIGFEAGYYQLNTDDTTRPNTAVGSQALKGSAGSSGMGNSAFGNRALTPLTSGDLNSAFGFLSLEKNTTGDNNSALGAYSLNACVSGARNNAFGVGALQTNTNSDNTAMGHFAAANNSTGDEVTAIGSYSGYSNSTADQTIYIGAYCGFYQDNARYATRANTVIGSSAAFGAVGASGSGNTILGHKAAYALTDGDYNVIIGGNAAEDITTGSNNVIIGLDAGKNITTATAIVAVGDRALETMTGAAWNTAIGSQSLTLATGGYNTGVGAVSLAAITTGHHNTALGRQAGSSCVTGTGNVFLGNEAGYFETGSDKLYIDNDSVTVPLIWGDFVINAIKVNGSFSSGTGTIINNDSTPSMAGANTFIYAGSANAVSIDALDDHVVGQYYTIFGNSPTYTITIIDGTPMGGDSFILDDALGTWVGGAYDNIVLYCYAADVFVEVSRKNN